MKFFKSFIGKIALVFCVALMSGVIGYTNVHAATVGQQLTTPESGWKRIPHSDKNFNFLGNWYENWYTEDGTNNFVQFNFTGDKIRYIGYLNPSYSLNTYISIDDKVYSFNQNGQNTYNVLNFEKLDLDNKEHYVKVYNKDKKYLLLEAIDIDQNAILKPYNENIKSFVSNITINKTTDTLQVNDSEQLIVTITPDNATNKTVKWTSDKPEVATVDENGKVTAIKEGIATITATIDGTNLSASCVVTVKLKDTTPTDNNGNAILTITMTNGDIKSYTVSMSKVNDFISWYNNRASGSNGNSYYSFDKTDKLQPFTKKTEHVVFDKISSFEVDEYSK